MTFKVPEHLRLAKFITAAGDLGTDASFGNNGAFLLQSPVPGRRLLVIASDGRGWDHVSVTLYNTSKRKRTLCPSWPEMCHVKGAFWEGEDVVVQIHPRESEYVNNHHGCLHLWRHQGIKFPTPDPIMVGIKDYVLDRIESPPAESEQPEFSHGRNRNGEYVSATHVLCSRCGTEQQAGENTEPSRPDEVHLQDCTSCGESICVFAGYPAPLKYGCALGNPEVEEIVAEEIRKARSNG